MAKYYGVAIEAAAAAQDMAEVIISSILNFLFTAFLNDLSDILKQHQHGMDFLGVVLVGIFFMDDLTLVAPSEEALLQLLELLHRYGDAWRIAFACRET